LLFSEETMLRTEEGSKLTWKTILQEQAGGQKPSMRLRANHGSRICQKTHAFPLKQGRRIGKKSLNASLNGCHLLLMVSQKVVTPVKTGVQMGFNLLILLDTTLQFIPHSVRGRYDGKVDFPTFCEFIIVGFVDFLQVDHSLNFQYPGACRNEVDLSAVGVAAGRFIPSDEAELAATYRNVLIFARVRKRKNWQFALFLC